MTSYKEVLQSEYFNKCYSLVEELKKDFPVNHGFIHIKHVIKNGKSLAKTFKLSNYETNLLLIACTLHDIGYTQGREDHAKSGAILARKYLESNSNLTNNEINVVCNAIASHGGDYVEDFRDKVSFCLIFADKLDFISSRYKKVKSTSLFRAIKKTELVKKGDVYYYNIYSTRENFEDELKFANFLIHKKLIGILDRFMKAQNVKAELNYKFIPPKN